MSRINDDRALPGETAWEGLTDDTVIFQRDCPDCEKGLLLAPARFCPRCQGSGFLTRTEPVVVTPGSQSGGDTDA